MKNNLVFYFLFFTFLLNSEILDFSISYLGIDVIDVKIEHSNEKIDVWATSTNVGHLMAKMKNNYYIEYELDYLPKNYQKKIIQKKYAENRIIRYDRQKKIANRTSFIDSMKNCEYQIKAKSRDFFSSLFYLRDFANERNGSFWLDANGLIWKAEFQVLNDELINTKLGKILSQKVKITFQKISKNKKKQSDMLTNNLVSEENVLFFWFSKDVHKIPIKAQYSMKPFPIIWNIKSYQK
ncbi:MAG: DUF3108 domain-containing protein [Candidatus Cloacimonetes bacterium]|jgi:hypothetical protein|nr:DUF3108 domain-containing protein [Candidatus Cloacimonadota bacterium]MBT6993649.1 DUF3108 domain-containing protein [Candidatus Cloacimonadota bacterium]MBT7470268.1 DUF3108 domain-containing protein [Candidatus Cloacimonadota bacterium]